MIEPLPPENASMTRTHDPHSISRQQESDSGMSLQGSRKSNLGVLTRDVPQVPTVILCGNPILHLGIVHLFSNTSFRILASEADQPALPPAVASEAALVITAGMDSSTASEVVKQLKNKDVKAKVVVLADHADSQGIARAHQAGADGMILSTTTREVLVKSLELIMLGERLFPASLLLDMRRQSIGIPDAPAQRASSAIQPPGDAPLPLRSLSERELEVLSRLTKGAQDKVIARDLNLAEATVKVHVKSLLKKLGAQNRTQAAVFASSYLP